MNNASHSLASLAQSLHGQGGLKVWSVIVSLMGDRLQTNLGPLQNRDLTATLGVLGISPDTIRVAIHRLRRDGWIDATKSGRHSAYDLTALAKDQTLAVAHHVYAAPAPAPHDMTVLSFETPRDAQDWATRHSAPRSLLVLDAVVFQLGSDDCNADAICSRVMVSDLPTWVQSRMAQSIDADELTQSLSLLRAVQSLVLDDDLTRTAARLLALHMWRRTVLRTNHVAVSCGPHHGLFQSCYRAFQSVLDTHAAKF
jgi:phenylacetic acid degradation operon negative regulatory protein